MKAELVEHGGVLVFDHVKIAVIAVTRHVISVLPVPPGVFHADVLGRNHLAVEHQVARAVFPVIAFDESQHLLHESLVVRIVGDSKPEAFSRFDQSVHPDGQVLPREVDVACVEERKHPLGLQVTQIGVVGRLHLMDEIDHLFEELDVRPSLTRGLLHAAVQVDRQHAFRPRRDASGAEGVAETVILDFIAQAAARSEAVGVVAHVSEERVAGGIHLGGQFGISRVDIAVACQ